MVASFGHDHQEHPVRAKACSVVQCLPDFGGGGVANDEDVFTSPHIHAGVDDSTRALGHHFGDIDLTVFILVGDWFGDGHA